MNEYLKVPAIKVNQPFGEFYLASIPASKLIKITYSLPAKYGEDKLDGVQRGINKKRVENIAKFCCTNNALFPNSVILAANILDDGSGVEPEDEWKFENDVLIIPREKINASIVDGQHRIEGLKKALENDCDDYDIVCSIYMDLPAPRQAEVFATINFNQQKVDKSLAYQLFGYDLDATDSKYWSPDTLAISLTRILNNHSNSAFKNHVSYGIKDKHLDFGSEEEKKEYYDDPWKISTSTMVEGIVRLISSNPTQDRYELHKKRTLKKDRSILEKINRRSSEPLRQYYLSFKDGQLYDFIEKYFSAVKKILWQDQELFFLKKTIGIQALFDLLKFISENNNNIEEYNIERFINLLSKIDVSKLKELDLSYSGIGRTQIRNILKEDIYN